VGKKKSIKKNFMWQICIEFTNMLLPLVTSPVLSRRLGAEALGVYSYVYTVTYYFLQFSLLGMFQYGTREIAAVRDDKDLLNKKFSELLCFQLIHGGMTIIAFVLYAVIFSKYTGLLLIQILYVMGASVILINYVFSGLEEFGIISVKTMVIRSIGVLLIFLFVRTKEDLPLYTLIMASEPLAGALVYIYLARKKVKLVRVKLRDAYKHIKGLYAIFIPIMATFLYATMDKLMLGNMSDMSQLGFYSNAEKALIAKNLAVALSVVLVPRMSKLANDANEAKFNDLLDKSIEIILLLTIAFGFGTAAVSSIFSVVFWGDKFTACSALIKIMSFMLPAYGLTYVINNQYLVPLKKEKIYIQATVLGVAFNVVFNLLLIPRSGAFGAAVATLMTQYVVLIYECVAIRKNYSIYKSIKGAVPYLAIAITMYLVVIRIDKIVSYSILWLVFEVLIGAIVFLVFCIFYWLLFNKTMYISILKNLISRGQNILFKIIKERGGLIDKGSSC